MRKKLATHLTVVLICATLILVLISSIGANILQTDGGNVEILDVSIPIADGEVVSAYIFKPTTATSANPAPCVITTHGGLNNKEMQDATCIELSRRGFVVVCCDMLNHGHSSATLPETNAALADNPDLLAYDVNFTFEREYDGNGMFDVIQYVYDDIAYIDNTKLGIMGHSQGSRCMWGYLAQYGRNQRYLAGIEEGATGFEMPESARKYDAEVAAAFGYAFFPDAYLLELMPEGVTIGYNSAYYDEAGTEQIKYHAGDGYFLCDMTVSPDAKNVINLVAPDTFTMDKEVDWSTKLPTVTLSNWDNSEKIELGKFYGSEETGYRVFYNPKETHPLNHFSTESTANIVSFFTTALDVENTIPADDQVWFLKEIFNLIGLIGFFLGVFAFGSALLQTPVFAGLRQPVPEALPAPTTLFQKVLFYGGMILLTGFSGWSFTKVIGWITLGKISLPSWLPQLATNWIIVWGILCALVSLAIFFLSYFVNGRKNGVSPKQWGLKISIVNLFKTLLLAVLIVIAVYQLLSFSSFFFDTDFRIWTFAVKTFEPSQAVTAMKYIPFFFIFYFVNSLCINGANRIAGQKEWVNVLLCILSNIVGIVVLIIVHFAYMINVGEITGLWWGPQWLGPLTCIPMVGILAFAAISSRYFFKKTGNIYLGAFLNTILIAVIQCANTMG